MCNVHTFPSYQILFRLKIMHIAGDNKNIINVYASVKNSYHKSLGWFQGIAMQKTDNNS